jgi:hypothetical protein
MAWLQMVETKIVRTTTSSKTTYIGWIWNDKDPHVWKGSKEFDTHRDAVWWVASNLAARGAAINNTIRVSLSPGDTVRNVMTGEFISFARIKPNDKFLCIECTNKKLHPIENIT